ncbi:protein kinase domain-containing protein [Colletotrichum sojae]|uniref:Protein kinase domain-containing protein n=1 Tax=Colletotrichum sojae TaxID=2175907 RepID=A0A8H6IS17_9PEZI|nr:protein kinase domain-containing protein [Colletotrichum sojae]
MIKPDAYHESNTNSPPFGPPQHGHGQVDSQEMSLKRQLEAALRPALPLGADEPRSVLSTRDLHRLVTPDSALRTLQQCIPSTPDGVHSIYAGSIFSGDQQYVKVFATLALIDRSDAIYEFMNLGISDEKLPLEPSICTDSAPESTIFHSPTSSSCFDLSQAVFNWCEAAAFNDAQWKVLAPAFELLDGDSTPRCFHPNTILPFVWNGPAEPVTKTGGTSKVYQVQILPGHHAFNEFKGHNVPFAVKQLQSHDDDAFNREVEAFKRFANDPEAHIVRLLTAFKVGNVSYLLFPWADTDLHSFFNKHDEPQGDHAILTVKQMLGVAEALKAIHYCRAKKRAVNDDQPNIEPVADVVEEGYHADLKPENILVADGQWKIADLGLSRFRQQSEAGEDKPLGCSPTYRAPEHDVGAFDGQKADIWSLGCVMSVAATWMTLGRKGVQDFRVKRAVLGRESAGKERRVDDSFFEVSKKQGGKAEPKLKRAVSHWINKVHAVPKATPVVHDLLDLVKDGMLVADGTSRITSGQLVAKLQAIYRKCIDDPNYAVPDSVPVDAGIDRPPMHPRDPFEHCRSISVNMARFPWPEEHLTQSSYTPDPGLSNSSSATEPSVSFNFTEPLYYPQLQPQNLGSTFGVGMLPANAVATEPMYGPSETLAPPANRKKRKSSGPLAGQLPSKRGKSPQALQPPQQRQSRQLDPASTPSTATSEVRETATPKSCSETTRKVLFPCPYFKHDHKKYSSKDWPRCGGPGWTISRLKEHINRRHSSKKNRCPRCRCKWPTAEELFKHQRSDAQCVVQEADSDDDDSIDADQWRRIQGRMRGTDESVKWREIYHIIFPSEPVPSPHREPTIDDFHSHLKSRLFRSADLQETVKIQNCLEVLSDFLNPRSLSQSSTDSTQSDLPVLTLDKSARNTTMSASPATLFELSPSPETSMVFAHNIPFRPADNNGAMPFVDFQLYPDSSTLWQLKSVDDGCPPPPCAMLQPNVSPQPNAMLQPNAVVPGTFQAMPLPKASSDSSAGQFNPPWF